MPPPLGPTGAGPSFGSLLAQLRLRRGWSQLRLAEQLCAASGTPTLSRHEISRWEREERIPGEYWLGWLAAVLETGTDALAVAAAASRARPRLPERFGPARPMPTRLGGVAALRPGGTAPAVSRERACLDLLGLAHAWLNRDGGPALGIRAEPGPARPTPVAGEAMPAAELARRLAAARHLDDVLGGSQTGTAARALVAAARGTWAGWGGRSSRGRRGEAAGQAGRGRPAALEFSAQGAGVRAETAQLLGWTLADAGAPAGALVAYRSALLAAATAGDRPLAGHILGCASYLLASTGDPGPALLLARTAYAGARQTAPPALRALLLHRVAFAAAGAGAKGPAEHALAEARREADRRVVAREPSWLYWYDDGEAEALTGRCLAFMGRPKRARPLLDRAAERSGQPRTSALDQAWLARALVDLGELDEACDRAGEAMLGAVRSGSVRVAELVADLRGRLAPHEGAREVRALAELAAAAPYLPTRAPSAATALSTRPGPP